MFIQRLSLAGVNEHGRQKQDDEKGHRERGIFVGAAPSAVVVPRNAWIKKRSARKAWKKIEESALTLLFVA